MDGMRILFFTPYVVSVMTAIIGIPLALKLVPPNGLYGVRTARTLENVDVWYAVNATTGIAMIILGILSTAIVFALHRFWGTETETQLIVPACVPIVALLYSLLIAVRGA